MLSQTQHLTGGLFWSQNLVQGNTIGDLSSQVKSSMFVVLFSERVDLSDTNSISYRFIVFCIQHADSFNCAFQTVLNDFEIVK